MMEVNFQSNRTFELGTSSGIYVLFYVIVVFQRKSGLNSQLLTNDSFDKPPVSVHNVLWERNNILMLVQVWTTPMMIILRVTPQIKKIVGV